MQNVFLNSLFGIKADCFANKTVALLVKCMEKLLSAMFKMGKGARNLVNWHMTLEWNDAVVNYDPK
jgi:hypothetical protein